MKVYIENIPYVEESEEAISEVKQYVYDALKNAFNENTIMDMYEGTKETDVPQRISHNISASYNSIDVNKPLYQSTINRWIHIFLYDCDGI